MWEKFNHLFFLLSNLGKNQETDYVTVLSPFFHPLDTLDESTRGLTVVQPVRMTDITYPRANFRSYRMRGHDSFRGWIGRSTTVRRDVRGVCPGSRSWTVNVRVAENGRAIRSDGAISPRSATRSYPPSTRRIFSRNDEERRMINATPQNCLLLTLERWIGLRSTLKKGEGKKNSIQYRRDCEGLPT